MSAAETHAAHELSNGAETVPGAVTSEAALSEHVDTSDALQSTIPGRLLLQGRRRGSMPATFHKAGGEWLATDFATYSTEVQAVCRALLAQGLSTGDRVCILGSNRREWVQTHVATMMAGAVPAGIYETCSSEEVAWIIGHAEARLAIVEDAAQLDKVLAGLEGTPGLSRIVMMEGAPPTPHEQVLGWAEFLRSGEAVPVSEPESRAVALDTQAPATFIYTSGTTGPPKAVMLSHDNLAWTADRAVELTGLAPGDSNLSYLPLSHIAEQVFSIHGPISGASAVYFVESRDKLADNLREVQPTVVFGVPRVWEKVYAAVRDRLEAVEGPRRRLISWATSIGRRVHARRNSGRSEGWLLGLQYRLAQRLVFDRLKPLLGLGAARICVSGAAPIRAEILEFFTGIDVVIHEVYGQSEDTGPTSFNLPGRTRFGSVGPVFPGVEVTLAEDNEILVRGPNVFLGYYRDPETTEDTLDPEGWLHSGDLGSFDEDGFLHITGRKKDIIITAGGKNIAPRPLEEALQALPLVSQAVVVGDRQRYLVALLVLEPDAAQAFAESEGLPLEDLPASDQLGQLLQPGVDELNAKVAKVETIKRWAVLPRELSQEAGELTPTLKIKRAAVMESWSELIEELYEGSSPTERGPRLGESSVEARPSA